MLTRSILAATFVLSLAGVASASPTVTVLPNGAIQKVWKNPDGSQRMVVRHTVDGVISLSSEHHIISSYVAAPAGRGGLSLRSKPILRVSQNLVTDMMRVQVAGGADEIF